MGRDGALGGEGEASGRGRNGWPFCSNSKNNGTYVSSGEKRRRRKARGQGDQKEEEEGGVSMNWRDLASLISSSTLTS